MSGNRPLLTEAARALAAAGVPSPDHDAAELLAHVLGVPRSRLTVSSAPTEAQASEFRALVARRSRREPLQHLTGVVGFRYVELAVGPGVFVPRPETELLAGLAVEEAQQQVSQGREPVVVDLGTGSGAVALAVATEVPQARVHAVELSREALGWAERNLSGSGVDLREGDMADAFGDLDGTVDVVVSNPPYVPLEQFEAVDVEAREHDPPLALWSGQDGLDAIRVLERTGARLLRPGGFLAAEHADAHGESAPAVFAATGRWRNVKDHPDLAGRQRFVTARLAR
jgi:release factor glutamine methyltransferase